MPLAPPKYTPADLMVSYIAHGVDLVTRQRYSAPFLRKHRQNQSVKARLYGLFINEIVQFNWPESIKTTW